MAKRSKTRKAGGDVAKGADAKQRTPRLSREWIWGLVLFLGVLLSYTPVWWAGYVWDDLPFVIANPVIAGPLGLKEIWTTSAADICPLTLSTFWLEYKLWGSWPLAYHLVNVALHGGCAVLLWQVLRRLRVPGAWLGAALWALHPVMVESVAFIAEMKNTESALFFLLAILFFVEGMDPKRPQPGSSRNWNHALCLLFSALAMASKSSTVVLPVVLCLCAWWVEGRWQWRNLARTAPVFLMAMAAGGLSLWTQGLHLAKNTDAQLLRTWPERLVTAGDAVWFYLGKLIWPYPLVTIYPRRQIDAGQWTSYLPLLAMIVGLFILWLKRETWSRAWFFVFAYFLVALLPVLGLINNMYFIYSPVADHFQYLAGMGPLALAGAGMVWLVDKIMPGRQWLQSILGGGLVVILGAWSWQRASVYENEVTLWTDVLSRNPGFYEGHNNLGLAFLLQGRFDDAIREYQKTAELNPKFAAVHSNIGQVFLQMGQVDKAIAECRTALEIDPNEASAYVTLGTAFARKGQIDDAISEFQEALKINPNVAEAHNNLGTTFLNMGRIDDAVFQYQEALRTEPNDADTHCNLGRALFKKGRVDQAIAEFQEALRLDPSSKSAQVDLARLQALVRQQAGGQ